MTDLLQVTSERTGTTVRISAAGEIDIATASVLYQQITHQLFANHAEIVVLDLTAVSFIDSSGLHALLKAVEDDRDRLRIIPSAPCLRLFEIAGVRDRLPVLINDEGFGAHRA